MDDFSTEDREILKGLIKILRDNPALMKATTEDVDALVRFSDLYQGATLSGRFIRGLLVTLGLIAGGILAFDTIVKGAAQWFISAR